MVSCDHCGKEEYMPFRCRYCGSYFCAEHRLPEMHDCAGAYQHSRSTTGSSQFTPTGYSYNPSMRATRYGLFGLNEIRDLGIGLGVILLVMLSSYWQSFFTNPLFMLGVVLVYGMAFILHELAHKFSAQKLGYWAEFRINRQGLMMTLFSLISPLKIIAPGAVMIGNIGSWSHYGMVAISGPATNIVLGAMFLAMGMFTGNMYWGAIARVGLQINASLALFNLIPLGVFDGAKIIRWNKVAWGAAVAAAGILYLI
jgi:Zn-dependent protease